MHFICHNKLFFHELKIFTLIISWKYKFFSASKIFPILHNKFRLTFLIICVLPEEESFEAKICSCEKALQSKFQFFNFFKGKKMSLLSDMSNEKAGDCCKQHWKSVRHKSAHYVFKRGVGAAALPFKRSIFPNFCMSFEH